MAKATLPETRAGRDHRPFLVVRLLMGTTILPACARILLDRARIAAPGTAVRATTAGMSAAGGSGRAA